MHVSSWHETDQVFQVPCPFPRTRVQYPRMWRLECGHCRVQSRGTAPRSPLYPLAEVRLLWIPMLDHAEPRLVSPRQPVALDPMGALGRPSENSTRHTGHLSRLLATRPEDGETEKPDYLGPRPVPVHKRSRLGRLGTPHPRSARHMPRAFAGTWRTSRGYAVSVARP